MLASRFVNIASDFVRDFNKLEVMKLLQNAANIAANRQSLNPQQFAREVDGLNERAEFILNNSIFNTYPSDLLNNINSNTIGNYLPTRIAKTIIDGFNRINKNSSTSSGEFNLHIEGANEVLHQMQSIITASNVMGIEPNLISEGNISFDLKLPRNLYKNSLSGFTDVVADFDSVFQGLIEYSSGSKSDVELVQLSTTDPVLALGATPFAIYGIMKFYKLMLEVAEKQINLYKSFKDLRKMSLPEEQVKQLEAGSESIVKGAVKEAVDETLKQIPSKVDEGRTNEIRVLLNKKGISVSSYIAGGARIYISIESQNEIDQMAIGKDGNALDIDVVEQLQQQKEIEARLDLLKIGYDYPAKALIEKHSNDPNPKTIK